MNQQKLNLLQSQGFPCGTWIALDMKNFRQATNLLRKCGIYFDGAKMHYASEADLRRRQKLARNASAKKTWWDRKAHDTPDTVRGIIRLAKNLGFDRVTIHIGNDYTTMYAALDEAAGEIEVVGISMLTSLSPAEIGIQTGMPVDSAVLLRARMAAHVGLSGMVCSPLEVHMLHQRRIFSKIAGCKLELSNLNLIVPGTRSTTQDMGGQVRVATAAETLIAAGGMNLDLVLGSEVWNAKNPITTMAEICDSLWLAHSGLMSQ